MVLATKTVRHGVEKSNCRLTGLRRAYRRFLACATLGIAIWVVVWYRPDLAVAWDMDIERVLMLLGLFLFQFVISTIPFLVLFQRLGKNEVQLLTWLKIMAVSRFGNLLLPQAGMAYRAVALKKGYGIPYTTYIHVYTLFAWMTTVLNLTLASVLSLSVLAGTGAQERLLTGGLVAITLGIALAPFAVQPVFRWWPVKGKWLSCIRAKLEELVHAVTEYGSHLDLIAVVVGFGLLRFGLWILFFRIALSGMGVQVTLAQLALFLAIWQLSSLLIITPGNLGVQEIVYGVVGGAVGIGAAHGVLLSALIRAAQYLVVFPLGLVCGGWGLLKSSKKPGPVFHDCDH